MAYRIPFQVVEGHQVASGLSKSSPYPKGTIELQSPYFKKIGLDLTSYHLATINIALSIPSIKLTHFDFYIKDLKWCEGVACESFGFISCQLAFDSCVVDSWLYYVEPTSKVGHFHPSNVLEIIAPKIPKLHYGDKGVLIIDKKYCQFPVNLRV